MDLLLLPDTASTPCKSETGPRKVCALSGLKKHMNVSAQPNQVSPEQAQAEAVCGGPCQAGPAQGASDPHAPDLKILPSQPVNLPDLPFSFFGCCFYCGCAVFCLVWVFFFFFCLIIKNK